MVHTQEKVHMKSQTFNRSLAGISLALTVMCGGLTQTANAQCETKRSATDGAYQDRFASVVSIDGDVFVVGAYGDDDLGDWSGSAYVFRNNTREAKLNASDGAENHSFGRAVSVSGDLIVVGAQGQYTSSQGSAYVFRYNGTDWIEEAILEASDGNEDDNFGASVSISGNVIAVGSSGNDAVYVFRHNGLQWVEEDKLTASDGYWADSFAYCVAVSGDVVVTGAPADDSSRGSAYVYRYNGTNWFEQTKLIASDGDLDDRLGKSIDIDGDKVVVGAHHDEANGYKAGSAYVFAYNGSTWSQEAKLIASDGVTYDTFGESVAISGGYVVVGAVWEDDNGAAYLYRYNGFGWPEQTKLIATDRDRYDWYGDAVSIDGDIALIGAYGDSDNGDTSGSAYIYDLNCKPDPTLAITLDPLVAGDYANFNGANLNPYTQTYLAYSLNGSGNIFVPQLNISLDLAMPIKSRDMGDTDQWGFATLQLQIPQIANGLDVWLQICQYELKTNVVETTVIQ